MSHLDEAWMRGDATMVIEPPRRERQPWTLRRARDTAVLTAAVLAIIPLAAFDVLAVKLALLALGVIR